MKQAPLKQERSEYGKLHRKLYESGDRRYGGRSRMKQLVPKKDGKAETITTVLIDSLLLEIYEVRVNRSWREQRKAVVTSEGDQYKSIWEAGTRMAQRYGCKASTARKEIRKAIRIHKPRYGRMWRFDEERIVWQR